MHRRFGKTAVVLALLAMVAMISACAVPAPSTVTKENYDKLEMGMTFDAVTEILGSTPHHSSRFGIQEYTWADGDRHIHAKFAGGRAIYYSCKGLEETAPEATVAKAEH
ncbi:MAG: DUF3862 domain-containing protein [Pseudomonadota bacterium]